MPKPKELKLFNGGRARGDHFYIAAYSVQDAARLMAAANLIIRGKDSEILALDIGRNVREINKYFSGCWGDSMKGVVPEQGVWYQKDGLSKDKPERII